MDFLTKFFDDESTIIGLCGFRSMKPRYAENTIEPNYFFNPFEKEEKCNFSYQTNFAKNVLLF